MISFTFNKELNFLKTKTSGIIGIKEILKHYNHLKENNSYPKNLNVLIDCCDSEFKIEPQEIPIFIDATKQTLQKYDSLTEAILIKKPYETVIATLFKDMFNSEKYNFKIFYTEEAAIKWLV